jgi:hypothetical protein
MPAMYTGSTASFQDQSASTQPEENREHPFRPDGGCAVAISMNDPVGQDMKLLVRAAILSVGISLDKADEIWSLNSKGDGVHRNRRSADNSYQKGSVRGFLWRKEQTTNPSLQHGTFFPASAAPAIACISHP